MPLDVQLKTTLSPPCSGWPSAFSRAIGTVERQGVEKQQGDGESSSALLLPPLLPTQAGQ